MACLRAISYLESTFFFLLNQRTKNRKIDISIRIGFAARKHQDHL